MLIEHWPYYDDITRYMDLQKTFDTPLAKLSIQKMHCVPGNDDDTIDHGADDGLPHDDVDDDDIKLFDLKQKMKLKPKLERLDVTPCRTCNLEEGSYNIFEACDTEGLDLAHKLKAIAGLEVRVNEEQLFNCFAIH